MIEHKKKLNAFIDDYQDGTPWQVVAKDIEDEYEAEQSASASTYCPYCGSKSIQTDLVNACYHCMDCDRVFTQ